MEFIVGKTRIHVVKGDITEQSTDAIVNAANRTLMGGGGVDGAIHRKGGPRILEECQSIRQNEYPDGLPTGKAVLTSGGNLKVKYVIHTVGPVWKGGQRGEPELLAQAYRNSLKLALSKGLRTIAFPSISTGAYGYPIEGASKIAVETVVETLKHEPNLDAVFFILFSQADLEVYTKTIRETLAL